jgi:hypothetical protein
MGLINMQAQYPYGILPERSNMKQDAYDAWETARDNHLSNAGTVDPQNMLRHMHDGGVTYQEYQSFAFMGAIYNSDWDAFHKLWNYTKYIASINTFGDPPVRHLQPWKSTGNGIIGNGMSFETADLTVSLYEAAVRDPSAVDADGQPFMELAGNAADEHWRTHVCHDPAPGIAGGARWKCGNDGYFIYLHYASPWGYFQRFADASGNNKWIEPYTYNGTQYKAADQGIREIFLKHIRDYNYVTLCHTMLTNGAEAGSNGSDDANSTYFGWGQARGLIKNAMTYCNWGHPDDYEICKFMADFFVDDTGGDPTNIQNGYKCTTGGGMTSPKPSMVGAAGLICMIDEQYQDFVNACWDWMVANISQWANDDREALMGAVYMTAMAGQLNLRLANNEKYINVNPTSLDFGNSSESQNIEITSDLSWNISVSDSWFSVNTNSGSNDATVTVSVNDNNSGSARSGNLTVENTTEGVSKTIEVYQAGPTYTLNVVSGNGGGVYEPGQVVDISASDPAGGMEFKEWTGDVSYIANADMASTTVTMPSKPITVEATYGEVTMPEAVKVTTPPTIDAVDDGFYGNSESILNQTQGSVFPESDDLSATWKAAWDDQYFYVFITTVDETQIADGPNWWKDDLIEVYIDGDNSKGASYDGVNDFQYVHLWNASSIQEEALGATSGVIASQQATANGYNTEIAFPWTTLGFGSTPSVNYIMGFDVAVCDDDDGGDRDDKLTWNATTDQGYNDPGIFGEIRLADETTDIDNLKFETEYVSFHPNPATDKIYFDRMVDVQISTLAGITVKSASQAAELDVSNLKSGLYVLKIKTGTQQQNEKLIIK